MVLALGVPFVDDTLVESGLGLVLGLVGMAVLELAEVGRVGDMGSVVVLLLVRVFGYHVVPELHGPLGFRVLLVEQVHKDVSVSLD